MTSPLDKVVHALRVVESIRRRRPELEITWVVRRVYEPLVASYEFVDHTLIFRRDRSLRSFAGLVREIRRSRYDYVLDFEGYARTGAMCFFAKGDRKIGLRSAREGASICYQEVVDAGVSEERHLLERFQNFSSVFGLESEAPGFLPAPPLSRRLARSAERRICLFPGRYKGERAWPGMLDLTRRLVETHSNLEVLLLGIVPRVFEDSLPERTRDLQGELSWKEICALANDADLVVANDNGPAQLAGAFGTPNLTLYSFVSAELRGSYPTDDVRNATLRAPQGDVSQLKFDAVYAAVESLLGS